MIREAAKKEKDDFGAASLQYQLATFGCEEDAILKHENVVLQLTAVFKGKVERSSTMKKAYNNDKELFKRN